MQMRNICRSFSKDPEITCVPTAERKVSTTIRIVYTRTTISTNLPTLLSYILQNRADVLPHTQWRLTVVVVFSFSSHFLTYIIQFSSQREKRLFLLCKNFQRGVCLFHGPKIWPSIYFLPSMIHVYCDDAKRTSRQLSQYQIVQHNLPNKHWKNFYINTPI